MADTKFTDLTELSTVASGDLLCIVDIDDTTDSATGTSKKITRSNLVGSLATTKTVVEKVEAFSVDPVADNGKVFLCYSASFQITFPALTSADNGAEITFILYKLASEVITFAKDAGDTVIPATFPQLDTDGDTFTVVCYYTPSEVGFILITNQHIS